MEIKDLLGYLGVSSEIDSLDAFKEAFNDKFLPTDQAHTNDAVVAKVIGKKFGSQKTIAKRLAKEFELELDDETLSKEPEHIFEHIAKTAKTKIEELDTLVKTKGDDAVKEWQEKYEKVNTKLKDYEGSVKSLKSELEKTVAEKDTAIRTFKTTSVYKDAVGSLKFSKNANDFAKKGFESIIKEKYVIEFDEKDEAYIADANTKQRIPNPAKAGEFLGIKDVFTMEADAGGLLEKNNATPTTPITFGAAPAANNGNNGNEKNLRAIPASQRV
jgi:ElaB/YqjD/DUF883 family membrane-anchored ribosome-binding protein